MTTSNRSPSTDLVADAVEKAYDARSGPLPVLRGASITVRSGESAAIMGPSGSGKSTLLSILGTLERPSGGRVRLGDVDPFALPAGGLAEFRNRRIGFIFQDHHLLPQCNALENVLIPTLARPASGAAAAADRARRLLDRVGLGGRMDHLPSELSGGERQRAAVARALINEPDVLLADEPTGSLDRRSSDVVADLLLELHAETNTILIVVTHNPQLAQRMQRQYELNDAQLLPVGGAAAGGARADGA